MTRHAELKRTLLALETLDSAGQIDLLREVALQSNGSFKTPRLGGKQYEKIARVRALDIYGQADNMNEAISNWCRGARRQIKLYTGLDQAERILRDEGPISDIDLRIACDFILAHSRCAGIRLIASSLLIAMDNAAAA